MKKTLLILFLSLPLTVLSQVANDHCNSATVLTVNNSTECTISEEGTFEGATNTADMISCDTNIYSDVWYEFTASAMYQYISLEMNTDDEYFGIAVYGNCITGEDSPLYCGTAHNLNCPSLEIGTTYKVRIYTTDDDPQVLNTDFTICVSTYPNIISVTDTTYSVEEIVSDVLLDTEPDLITSNITYSTGAGTNENGIGYFNNNDGNFPFTQGLVLSNGGINNIPGPNTSINNIDSQIWLGDDQLTQYINDYEGNVNTTNFYNASIVEFDFIPITNYVSFEFIFASEEYGMYQCIGGDSFAVFLTDLTESESINIATLPGTTLPISTKTIRDNTYNSNCSSANSAYFDSFVEPSNSSMPGVPINFNGRTIPINAQAYVIPGNTYHLKFVISDRGDPGFDSAVFINGENFNLGTEDDGIGIYAPTGHSLQFISEGESIADLVAQGENIQWYADEDSSTPLDESTLLIDGVTYYATQTVNYIESTDRLAVTAFLVSASNLTSCDQDMDGFELFDLHLNLDEITEGLEDTPYYTEYYLTYQDAIDEFNAIENPMYINVVPYTQTIYIRLNYFWDNSNHAIAALELQTLSTPEITSEDITEYGATSINLTAYSSDILDGLPIQDYTVSFHITEASANAGTTEIENPDNYAVSDVEMIWVRVEDNETGCFTTASFSVNTAVLPPNGNALQLFSEGETIADLSADGENILWYADEMSTTTLSESTPLTDGITYYATQTINDAESTERLAVTAYLVSANNIIVCDQNMDGYEVFDLTSNYDQMITGLEPTLYYTELYPTYEDAVNETNVIENPLFTNTTPNLQIIYVRLAELSDYSNYAISSFELQTQPVPEVNIPDGITEYGASIVSLTSYILSILDGLPVEYYTVSFYSSEADANAGEPEIENPNEYTVTDEQIIWVKVENNETGCFTIDSFFITTSVPTPAGEINQDFTEGETLADIEIEGENIQWYENDSEGTDNVNDEPDSDSPLPTNTLLVDGETYYATQTINGTESFERLAVTVHKILGVKDHAFKNFNYYPNPVKNILTLTNTDAISKVEVYNLLGQKIMVKDFNDTTIHLDIAIFETGIYLVKVISLEQENIIRIQKK